MKKDDFPTLGTPTMPIARLLDAFPSMIFFSTTCFLGGILALTLEEVDVLNRYRRPCLDDDTSRGRAAVAIMCIQWGRTKKSRLQRGRRSRRADRRRHGQRPNKGELQLRQRLLQGELSCTTTMALRCNHHSPMAALMRSGSPWTSCPSSSCAFLRHRMSRLQTGLRRHPRPSRAPAS